MGWSVISWRFWRGIPKVRELKHPAASGLLKEALPPADIMPSSELVADLPIDADLLETQSLMECDAGRIGQANAGKSCMKTPFFQVSEKMIVERKAYP